MCVSVLLYSKKMNSVCDSFCVNLSYSSMEAKTQIFIIKSNYESCLSRDMYYAVIFYFIANINFLIFFLDD